MKKLHINLISDNNNFVPKEGQRDLMCSNEASSRGPLSSSPVLSKDTLDALKELGDVLRDIHKRMISEGYEIMDGVIRKKEVPQCI